MLRISSSVIVNATLWVLIGFSVITWTIVLAKAMWQLRTSRANTVFERAFWAAPDLQSAARLEGFAGPSARLAQTGFTALHRDGAEGHDLEHSGDRRELLERVLRQGIGRERRAMESGLAVLASIGSTAPFVGLFGTVWGIIHALQSISHTGAASLDVVAAPIGEALVATATGIAVAVPAVLAYNFFVRRVKLASASLEDFGGDFLNLAIRADLRQRGAGIGIGVAAREA